MKQSFARARAIAGAFLTPMKRLIFSLVFSGFLIVGSTLLTGSSQASVGWLDQSHQTFFPKNLSSIVSVQADFPVLWWSFLVIEPITPAGTDWAAIKSHCSQLKARHPDLIAKIFCGGEISSAEQTLFSWSADYPLRHLSTGRLDLESRMSRVLAKASLPIGSLVKILRLDPFDSLMELQTLLEKKIQLKLENKGGFFFDPASGRVLIPIQLAFAPSETRKMSALSNDFALFCANVQTAGAPCQTPILIGAHASTLENETQIKDDLGSVSAISGLFLVVMAAFVFFTRRWRLLLIGPPILIAILISALVTYVVFGSIHGLTLAFGPGIIGLAMDYGLHIGFSNQPQRLWKANFTGLLTTIVVLLVMMLSQIPLLRQLMFFSALGLSLGFLSMFFLFNLAPTIFSVKPYSIGVPRSWVFSAVIVALVIASVVGMFTIHLNLDMRQLNFEKPQRAALNRWLYETAGLQAPLLEVTEGKTGRETLQLAQEQRAWAALHEIDVNSAAEFIPDLSTQKANLKTWQSEFCQQTSFFEKLPAVDQQFFQPFMARVANLARGSWDNENKASRASYCSWLRPRVLDEVGDAPAYIRDFGHHKKWLTLWLPRNREQAAQIKGRNPDVISFVDMAMLFPKIFAGELAWMTPVSLGLAFLILVIYYRRFSLAFLGVIPFFSGLGLYALLSAVFHWNTSFISVIGLIMVFGFSLDYGVFATDLMRRQKERPDDGVWTALTVAATVNVAGFLPLVFCQHPVLNNLGHTLLFGTIGTYLGSVWGIPGLYRLVVERGPWLAQNKKTTLRGHL